ncbi:MAG: hypothetical protein ISS19_18685 [Bacteroidales bacterium]|nr:hypothetical protein [Bacteroidales bacterium]
MDEDLLPRVDEPMEEYLRSDRYRQYGMKITFSDFKGQEEANYRFWRSLTPRQRLELHVLMIEAVYQSEIEKSNDEKPLEIVFTEITV